MNELCTKSATDLAHMIRAGETSSREVVDAHLERIDEVNGYVNAVTVSLADTARAAADAADETPPEARTGAFHGVPFTIKENIDCVGSPTTNGVPALANALPEADAPIVARMKAAGAIPLGRTNLPELGARLDTDNPLRGRTRNPWNGTLTPGGSSGGEAAALAVGMTPFGLGNDIGGSLRNPAYCCGIAALKPTVGRVPYVSGFGPDLGFSVHLLTDGPMARSVADLRTGLAIMAGRHIDDPLSVDAPLEGARPERPRAALVKEIPGYTLPSATVAEIDRAGGILRDKGWEVVEAQAPELDQVNDIWGKVLTVGGFEDMKPLIRPAVYQVLDAMRAHFKGASTPNDWIHSERRRLRRLWSHFLTEHTVAIGPTWTCLPWPIDADLSGPQVLIDTARFITPGNVLGLPAVALPMGVQGGLATGIQLYADLYREDLCLWAAELIEGEVDAVTPIDPVQPPAAGQ